MKKNESAKNALKVQLPLTVDTLMMIFRYCSQEDICRFALVNKVFHRASLQDALWSESLQTRYIPYKSGAAKSTLLSHLRNYARLIQKVAAEEGAEFEPQSLMVVVVAAYARERLQFLVINKQKDVGASSSNPIFTFFDNRCDQLLDQAKQLYARMNEHIKRNGLVYATVQEAIALVDTPRQTLDEDLQAIIEVGRVSDYLSRIFIGARGGQLRDILYRLCSYQTLSMIVGSGIELYDQKLFLRHVCRGNFHERDVSKALLFLSHAKGLRQELLNDLLNLAVGSQYCSELMRALIARGARANDSAFNGVLRRDIRTDDDLCLLLDNAAENVDYDRLLDDLRGRNPYIDFSTVMRVAKLAPNVTEVWMREAFDLCYPEEYLRYLIERVPTITRYSVYCIGKAIKEDLCSEELRDLMRSKCVDDVDLSLYEEPQSICKLF